MNDKSAHTISNKYEIKDYFKEWYPGLVVFAQQFVSSVTEAEDVVQNAFIKLFENFEGEKDINAVKGYLYKIIRNECINLIKHEAVKRKHQQSAQFDIEHEKIYLQKIVEEETYLALSKAIKSLPTQCREVLMLSLNGLKNNEIAEDLEISVNTVKSQKKRAYSRIREQLKDVYQIVAFISSI